MSYLPVTVIIVLSASLLTAMVFVPAVGFFIGRTDKETVEQFGHFADDEHADFRKMKGLDRALSPLHRTHHPPSGSGRRGRADAHGRHRGHLCDPSHRR